MRSHRLRLEYLTVDELTPAHWVRIQRAAEQALVTTAGLRQSITARERIALYTDADQAIVGLTTADLRHERIDGRDVAVLYVGNTWLAPQHRGKNLFYVLTVLAFVEMMLRWPRTPRYAFFGCNSFRSYLKLARNYPKYWPRRGTDTPAFEHALIQHLAAEYYGPQVDAQRLVLEAEPETRSFKEADSAIPASLVNDPELRYFVTRNPGYARGSKLMCLGELSWACIGRNSARYLRRALRRRMGRNTSSTTLHVEGAQ